MKKKDCIMGHLEELFHYDKIGIFGVKSLFFPCLNGVILVKPYKKKILHVLTSVEKYFGEKKNPVCVSVHPWWRLDISPIKYLFFYPLLSSFLLQSPVSHFINSWPCIGDMVTRLRHHLRPSYDLKFFLLPIWNQRKQVQVGQ